MVLKIFTKGESLETRSALELGENLEKMGNKVEYFDADQAETIQLLEIYDIYSFPTFLVTQEDGKLVAEWKGATPLEADVKSYLAG